MTSVLEEVHTESVTDEVTTDSPASWPSRAGAFAVDVLFGLFVLGSLVLVWFTSTSYSWLWWTSGVTGVLIFVLVCLNRWLAADFTGWTLGRALFGIEVVRRDGEPAKVFRLLLRDVAHVLDTAPLFVGWLWPLWDKRNRTFADLLVRTEVRRAKNARPNLVRTAGAVLTAGAVIAAAGAGLTYLTVYQHDKAVNTARAQIADQGPRIVEELLTYHAGSMKDDFARAQGLVTDDYRQKLIEQQQAVQKNAATTNEYWAVTSSVLSADPDKATMLMFLQGQRQAQQQEVRFITATARVTFVKIGDAWRVSELTVLPGPAVNRGGQ